MGPTNHQDRTVKWSIVIAAPNTCRISGKRMAATMMLPMTKVMTTIIQGHGSSPVQPPECLHLCREPPALFLRHLCPHENRAMRASSALMSARPDHPGQLPAAPSIGLSLIAILPRALQTLRAFHGGVRLASPKLDECQGE